MNWSIPYSLLRKLELVANTQYNFPLIEFKEASLIGAYLVNMDVGETCLLSLLGITVHLIGTRKIAC
jgi:hypothetical protein